MSEIQKFQIKKFTADTVQTKDFTGTKHDALVEARLTSAEKSLKFVKSQIIDSQGNVTNVVSTLEKVIEVVETVIEMVLPFLAGSPAGPVLQTVESGIEVAESIDSNIEKSVDSSTQDSPITQPVHDGN